MNGLREDGFSLDAGLLKITAIIAMTVDHIGWAFFNTFTMKAQIMHFIGRLTFPIMAFFIAEGFYRTHDLKKYLTRLGLFALLSHIPFQLFIYNSIPTFSTNPNMPLMARLQTGVIYTLFLGLLALTMVKKTAYPWYVKSLIIILICILSIPGDYSYYGVLLILTFGLYRNDKVKMYTIASVKYSYLYFRD